MKICSLQTIGSNQLVDQWEIDNYQYFTSTSSVATYGVVRLIYIGNHMD